MRSKVTACRAQRHACCKAWIWGRLQKISQKHNVFKDSQMEVQPGLVQELVVKRHLGRRALLPRSRTLFCLVLGFLIFSVLFLLSSLCSSSHSVFIYRSALPHSCFCLSLLLRCFQFFSPASFAFALHACCSTHTHPWFWFYSLYSSVLFMQCMCHGFSIKFMLLAFCVIFSLAFFVF